MAQLEVLARFVVAWCLTRLLEITYQRSICHHHYLLGVCVFHIYEDMVHTVELQWLERLCDHENMFETGAVQTDQC